MYRALYRKWRPATFEDVVGQTGITTALKNQILHDRVGHAYIFTGTRGTGKTTCAKIFAKAVNCVSRNGADPCGKCHVCTGIDSGSVMDVVEIDAASNNGVDNIRDLRDETAYTPSECTYKVYIIDEVHMLSAAAFNALLKIMEEPPAHVIFILATTEIHKVPATILSRCQRYDFTRIAPDDIKARLLYVAGQEKIELSQDAAGLIARLADGAMRDALSILDTCAGVTNTVDADVVRRMAGVTDKSYLFELSGAIARSDAAAALLLVAQLREKSVDIKRLCDELILHYRNLLLAGVHGAGLLVGVSEEEEKRYTQAAAEVPQSACVRAIRALSEALDKMGRGTDARIELELTLFNLCSAAQPLVPAPAVPTAPAPAPRSTGTPQPQPFAAFAVQPAAQPAASPEPEDAVPWREEPAPVLANAPPERTQAPAPAAPAPAAPAPLAQEPQHSAPVSAPLAQEPQHSAPAPAPRTEPAPAPVHAARPVGAEKASKDAGRPKAVPFEAWPQVIERMKDRDKMLFAHLEGTKAYLSGRYVLIDGGELFLEFMRQNEYSNERLKQIIQEVTGTRYNIGPYKKASKEARQEASAEDALAALAQQGVEVVYTNEP